jgi:cytochrome c-type biogenesis protein
MLELFIAFGAGLISFLSPCVLPLIPGYVSFISGNTLNEILEKKKIDLLPLIVFSLGFSFVFIIFGATASFLGKILLQINCRSYNNHIFPSINWCFKY